MPSKEVVENNTQEFGHIFAASIEVLTRFLNAHQIGIAEATTNLRPPTENRKRLLKIMHYNLRQAEGFFEEFEMLTLENAHQIGLGKVITAAMPRFVYALIYANAAQKANQQGGKPRNRKVEEAAASARNRVLDLARKMLPAQALASLEELDQHLLIAKSFGWQRRDGETHLLQIIGATWCRDTAEKVIQVAAAFELPVHFLNMWREDEILEDEAEQTESQKGFLKHLDHAFVVIRTNDNNQHVPVPVVIFPDHSILIEPSAAQFVVGLVRHGLL